MLAFGRSAQSDLYEALISIEKFVRYYAFEDDETASGNVDLAESSKEVGAQISKLGYGIFRLSLSKSIHVQLLSHTTFNNVLARS